MSRFFEDVSAFSHGDSDVSCCQTNVSGIRIDLVSINLCKSQSAKRMTLYLSFLLRHVACSLNAVARTSCSWPERLHSMQLLDLFNIIHRGSFIISSFARSCSLSSRSLITRYPRAAQVAPSLSAEFASFGARGATLIIKRHLSRFYTLSNTHTLSSKIAKARGPIFIYLALGLDIILPEAGRLDMRSG